MSRYILKYCAPVHLYLFNRGIQTPGPGVIRQINSQIHSGHRFHRDLTDYNLGQISFDVRHIYPYGLSSGTYGPYIDFFVLTDNYFDCSEVSIGKIGEFITKQLSGDWGRNGFDFITDEIYTVRSATGTMKFELCELITEEAYMKMVSDFENSDGHTDSYYGRTDPMDYVRYDRYELEDALKTLKDLERTLVS